MKKVILLLLLVPTLVMAQKPIKPNLNKALNSFRANKLDEAKTMIDVCVTDAKLMNDGKSWYYRGLIYAALDTTTNETFKALAENPLATALESFEKAESMAKPGSEYFITDPNSVMPVTKTQQIDYLSSYYVNIGASAYQEDDYEGALAGFEKAQKVKPNDTTAFFFGGIVASAMEDYQKSNNYLAEYVKLGGTSPDAYSLMINAYNGPLENKEKALEVTREAKTKFPSNTNFARVEIGILIDMNKIEDAKSGLEKAVSENPEDKTLQFFLGYAHVRTENLDAAKACFEKALQIDPKYFDAQLWLAKTVSEDAKKIKREMNALGITEADRKKKFALDKVYMEKLKVALPYWEKAEKMNPSDSEVLDELYNIYVDLDMQPQVQRIEKRYKELGLDN